MKSAKRSWLSESVETLKKMFWEDFQDRKRLKALDHLYEVKKYRQRELIRLVQESYRNGFLEQEERTFLNWVLEKNGIDYTLWAHKTPGLKAEIARLKKVEAPKVRAVQLPLFPDIDRAAAMPTHLLPKPKRMRLSA